MFLKFLSGVLIGITFTISVAHAADTKNFVSPDILVLGDSQISFGSGPAFLDFFTDIKAHCNPNEKQKQHLKKLGEMKVGVIGVRSTSIQSWTARKGRAKGAVCDVDPKWKVNAGAYGFVNTTKNKYVQIGRGPQYQFCSPNKSPFETMFRDDYYKPKLLLMSFLGNSARRWANNKDLAIKDVEALMHQVPEDIPCIFMTTAPAFKKKIVDLRLKAQKNLMEAFEETGNRCTFVPGATPATVAANQGNRHYFRLNKRDWSKTRIIPTKEQPKTFSH